MATIGTITALFNADTGGLRAGVSEAIDYFQQLRDEIRKASEASESFAAILNAQAAVAVAALNKMDVQKSIAIEADASALQETVGEADRLTAALLENSPTVRIAAEVTGLDSAEAIEGTVAGVAAGASSATSAVRQFGEIASELFSRSGEDAVEGAERFDTLRLSTVGVAVGIQSAYSAVQSAANLTAGAVNAVGSAAQAIGQAGQDGFGGFQDAVDSAVVAVGRSYDAAVSVASAFRENIPQALAAASTGYRAFVAQLGGVSTHSRAAGGSAAATAVAVGSLGSALASAAVSIGTYATVVTAARIATSGLSDEARAYVERGAQFVGAIAGAAAGASASAASYRLVAGALFSSANAAQFFQRLIQGVGQGIQAAALRATAFAGVMTQINSVLSVVTAAANESTTALGFAGLVARTATLAAGFGALAGGVRAFAAGASIASGATAGAAGAIAGLASTFPIAAAGAIAAAVATGRFFKELENLGSKAESIEQMAERFGSSNEGVEKLRVAAANANVSMMALTRSQQAFYTNLSKVKSGQFDTQNVREAKIAFDELGIPVEKLKTLKPEEAFRLVAKSLSEVKNAADKTRIAVDLFGARGAFILPALKEIGDLEEDFNRLGGAIRAVDFGNLLRMEASFDRLKNASAALDRTLLVPFVSMQRAFNNFSAELKGGLASALAPLATMLNAIATPVAVLIESFGRMINVTLRLIGVFTGVAVFAQVFGTIARIFEGIGEGFRLALSPLEQLVDMFSSASGEANALSVVISAVEAVLNAIGIAIGFVVGILANAAVALAAGAAAWVVYNTAVALASATSIAAAASFAMAWAAALGPFLPLIGLIVGGIALIGGAVMALAAGAKAAFGVVVGLGRAVGLVGKERVQIDASTASTRELASAAREAQDAASWFSNGESDSTIANAVDKARGSFNGLVTESLRYGKSGSDTVASVQKRFADLQQSLSEGKISTAEFTQKTEDLFATSAKGMKDAQSSAAVVLSQNIELYKQLDDSVKQAGKSVRDLSAGTVVEDKLFPASEEVKRRASQYRAEYAKAIDEIKSKQQSGGFQIELDQRRQQLEADVGSGKIDPEQYAALKVELDATNAQEQAKFATDEVQREFDRKIAVLKADVSFADNIRKELETAFLSPVQKFEKELQKIRDNKSLTPDEQALAETDLRKKTTESLVGKSAQTQLQERSRDVTQAAAAGLIDDGKLNSELQKAADDFARAVGVTQTPFESFSSSLNNITAQFGFAGEPIDQVREKLKGNAEQLDLFDRAVKESRDNLLQSLGIEKTPQEVFNDQMKKIDEAVNSADPNKRITKVQAEQARTVATRRRDEALGAGADVAGQIADRRRKIEEAYGGGQDPAKMEVAQNKLAMDRREAAGLDATPAQALKAGVDKINDAFGVTGKSMEDIRASLSPEDFKEYQEAVKKNSDAVKASLGVEKNPADKFAESREKLEQAVKDGVITEQEKNKAIKDSRDNLLSSLGISKSPVQDFEDSVAKIRENASELNPDEIARGLKEAKDKLLSSLGIPKTPAQDFEDAVTKIRENASALSPDELARGLKEAKDKLLSSLGIDKSPAQQAEDAMVKLREAFNKGQISAEEFAKGSQKAKDTLLQSLGIPLDPVTQLGQRLQDLDEAFSKGQISQEEFTRGQDEARRSMLPGGEQESPVKKFERDMEAVDRALSQDLISEDDAALRKKNLQAQLQEDLKPALDATKADRRGIEGADARSKQGVDTFFRILRGNDNPSLKAQLEVARNTKILAEAARNPKAAPVIAQLSAK